MAFEKLTGLQYNADLQRIADKVNELIVAVEELQATPKPVKRTRKAKVATDT